MSRHAVDTAARAAIALLLLAPALAAESDGPELAWRQWGGPHGNFVVDRPADAPHLSAWPAAGPRQLWSRPLGTGHSAILFEDGRLFTLYRPGDGRGKTGPWRADESVIALDASSGRTLWEHRYPSAVQDFSRGAGPHSTPLLAGDRLFAIGTNQELHALDKRTGEVLWSVDFVADLGAPPLLVRPIVKSGYTSSPIAYRDLVVCFVGGPGQSVVAFRQSDGSIAWKSGHFLVSGASPLLIEVDGEEQLVFFAGSLITGLAPATGEVLWVHAHDAGNDFNFSQPLYAGDQILFLSSGYRAGSRALQLRRQGGETRVEELWFDNRTKFQFLNAVRVGDTIYGTTGESGTAFLTAIDVKSGESRWRHRGLGQSTLLSVDDELLALTEDGDLVLLMPKRDSVEELARATVFDTTAWTVPTLVGSTLYARDREKIVAFDLSPSPALAGGATP